MGTESFNEHLYGVLETMRGSLNLSHMQWAAMLSVTKKDYFKIYFQKKIPAYYNLKQLAARLDVSPEKIIFGTIDYKAMTAHFEGNSVFIPEKYTVGALSRMRTFSNILDYVEARRSVDARNLLRRQFQIPCGALNDLDTPVNIVFFMEVTDYLAKAGMGQFRTMGAYSIRHLFSSELGKALSSDVKNTMDLYEKITSKHYGFFDENSKYSIVSLTPEGARIKAQPSEKLQDTLKMWTSGNTHACSYRAGVMSSFPGLLGLESARVEELRCVHRGDPYCLFDLIFKGKPTLLC